MNYRLDSREPLTLERQIGGGGEAVIYTIRENTKIVAKVYHKPTASRVRKLRAMLENPPLRLTGAEDHVPIAWPQNLIYDDRNYCVGFTMMHIKAVNSVELSQLYNPQDRRLNAPGFSWQYLMRTGRNLAGVLDVLHSHGYIVGDLNESNLLVSNTALLTLVDCDSMQVSVGSGADAKIFRCPVGKAEYTPPELQNYSFGEVDRRPEHDNFGLAVLIFMLLMEGVHPYQCRWTGVGEPPTLSESIERGLCPYVKNPKVAAPIFALSFNILPPNLQALFQRCFGEGHSDPATRPTAAEWYQALREAESQLSVCTVNSQHRYSQHLEKCPWCERMKMGVPDPFPDLEQLQLLVQQAQVQKVNRLAPSRRVVNATVVTRRSSANRGSAAVSGWQSTASVSSSNSKNRFPAILSFSALLTLFFFVLSWVIIFISITHKSPSYPTIAPGQYLAQNTPASFASTNLNSTNSFSNVFAQSASTATPLPVRTISAASLQITALSPFTHSGNAQINVVAFSPNDKYLAAGGNDNSVKIWDVASGQLIQTLAGFPDWVDTVKFSPDGNTLAAVSQDGTMKLWNTQNFQLITTVKPERPVGTVAFTPDSRYIATSYLYTTDAPLWELSSGRLLHLFSNSGVSVGGNSNFIGIKHLLFSPDNSFLAANNVGNSVILYSTKTTKILHTLMGHSGAITSFAFSPDGQTFATASADETVRVWNVQTGQQLKVLQGSSAINAVAFSPDGNLLVTGSSDGTLTFWGVQSGKPLKSFSLAKSAITSITFNAVGSKLVIADASGAISVWSVSD